MIKVHCMKTLAAPHWILTKSGLWPVKTLSIVTTLKITFNIIIDAAVYILIVHNIINAVNSNNTKLLNWMTCIVIPITGYIAKSATLLLNKSCFFSIVDDLKSATFNLHSEQSNKHIKFINKISIMMMRYFATAQIVFALIFNILPFVMNIQMMLPPSFNTGRFDVAYKIVHLFAAIYLGFNSTALDILCMVLMALCAAQLNILEERLTNILLDKLQNNNAHLKLDNVLRDCVILHQMING